MFRALCDWRGHKWGAYGFWQERQDVPAPNLLGSEWKRFRVCQRCGEREETAVRAPQKPLYVVQS